MFITAALDVLSPFGSGGEYHLPHPTRTDITLCGSNAYCCEKRTVPSISYVCPRCKARS